MRTLGFLIVFVGSMMSAVAQTRPAAPQPATGTARIRGTLIDATTATPVRRASLRLQRVPSTRDTWTTISDANGAFEFPSLPAGRFALQATKGGYITRSAGQRTTTDVVKRSRWRKDRPSICHR